MIFITAPTLADAERCALEFAAETGWIATTLEANKSLRVEASGISDPALYEAAEAAIEDGRAMVVYADEIPPDA